MEIDLIYKSFFIRALLNVSDLVCNWWNLWTFHYDIAMNIVEIVYNIVFRNEMHTFVITT